MLVAISMADRVIVMKKPCRCREYNQFCVVIAISFIISGTQRPVAENSAQSTSCIMRPGIGKGSDLHEYSVHLLCTFFNCSVKLKQKDYFKNFE